MTLVKWSPFRGLSGVENEMEELYRGFDLAPFARRYGRTTGNWEPAADIVEKKDRYEIIVELAGVNKEDVKVDLNDEILTITGEKKYAKESDEDNHYICERAYGNFNRRFTLPGTVDRNKVEATYKDGVLHLTLPKAESAKPKQIEIH